MILKCINVINKEIRNLVNIDGGRFDNYDLKILNETLTNQNELSYNKLIQ